EIANRRLTLQRQVDAVEAAVAKAGQRQRGLSQGLGRKRAGVGRRAAEHRLPLDHGHALAEVRSLRRALFTRGAGADDHQIESLFAHSSQIDTAGSTWKSRRAPPA